MTKTLAEKVKKFSMVRLKKTHVKIPSLKIRKRKSKSLKPKKNEHIPISSIVNILIKNAIEKTKREKKEKGAIEDKDYSILKEEIPIKIGGYGTSSKSYSSLTKASYIDYSKLFSYLGKFKSQSPYENFVGNNGEWTNRTIEDKGFSLIDNETMDQGARHVKYFNPQVSDMHIKALSLVPITGMSSSEWEQFKLWMKLDPVMYRLKTSTS